MKKGGGSTGLKGRYIAKSGHANQSCLLGIYRKALKYSGTI